MGSQVRVLYRAPSEPLETTWFQGFFFFPKNAVKISGKCVVFAAKRVDNGYRERKEGQRRMEDREIIRLLFERSEGAISALSQKYGLSLLVASVLQSQIVIRNPI